MWQHHRINRLRSGFDRLSVELGRQLTTDSDLSCQDYLVPVALTDRRDGRMRLFEVGEQLGWEKSRLCHQVARMAYGRLVTN